MARVGIALYDAGIIEERDGHRGDIGRTIARGLTRWIRERTAGMRHFGCIDLVLSADDSEWRYLAEQCYGLASMPAEGAGLLLSPISSAEPRWYRLQGGVNSLERRAPGLGRAAVRALEQATRTFCVYGPWDAGEFVGEWLEPNLDDLDEDAVQYVKEFRARTPAWVTQPPWVTRCARRRLAAIASGRTSRGTEVRCIAGLCLEIASRLRRTRRVHPADECVVGNGCLNPLAFVRWSVDDLMDRVVDDNMQLIGEDEFSTDALRPAVVGITPSSIRAWFATLDVRLGLLRLADELLDAIGDDRVDA